VKKTQLNMFYEFKGFRPVVHPTAFVHPQAVITGHVVIGQHVYIGPGAAIRGDWGGIVIEDGCNVQENCTIHMFPGVTALLKEGAHIGHGAIIHGATIGRNCLVGMNSVIMDNVDIGDECIIGALCFIKADEKIPPRSLVVGNPGKIVRQVSDEMIAWKTEGTPSTNNSPTKCGSTGEPANRCRRCRMTCRRRRSCMKPGNISKAMWTSLPLCVGSYLSYMQVGQPVIGEK
jgi:phenylacetic acid degradation protein